MKWQALLSLKTLVAGLLDALSATEVCMQCRPLEFQRAPGIGIDLSMSRGTAAVKFRNGTMVHVAEVPGSLDYILAMRTLAEDALRLRSGGPSLLSLPEGHSVVWVSFTSLITNFTIARLYEYIYQPHDTSKYVYCVLDKPAPWAQPTTAMLSTLKSTIEDTVPLAYPFIMLSIPDFEADTGHIYKLFEIACQQAGFELLYPVMLASRAALKFYGIEDCYDGPDVADEYCPFKEKRVDVVLAVTYSDVNLGVTLLTRWLGASQLWGTMWPKNLTEAVDLGYGSSLRVQDPEEYWKTVKSVIGDVSGDESVDRIIYLGSHGDDRELQEIVEGLTITSKKGQVKKAIDDTDKESLFIAARGAAIVARHGMKKGFDGCLIPDRCQVDDENENLDKDVTKDKTEL